MPATNSFNLRSLWSSIIQYTTSHLLFFQLFVVSLFFSYQPTLSFGMTAGIHLKLGLPIFFGIIFVITSIPSIIKHRMRLLKHIGVRLFLAFVLINTLSIAWSSNKPRALLETSLIWLLCAISTALMSKITEIYQHRTQLVRLIFITTLFVCAFAYWQLIADALNISPALTLLSTPYRAALFGVARPTGFALEPEFLASLLVIPILFAADGILRGKRNLLATIVLIIASSTLLLTISRGGLLAVAIGFVLLLIFVRSQLRGYVTLIATVFGGGLLGLALVGIAATMNTRDTITASSAVTGIVRQVSLGKIDLKSILVPVKTTPVSTSSSITSSSRTTATPAPASPTISIPAYVEESTNSRLEMSQEAETLWTASPKNFLVGIGVGAFGKRAHAAHSQYSISSIVNNEYLQVACELGIVGLLLFLALTLIPIFTALKRRRWYIAIILVALYSQWFFYSGNINAFHIWAFLALAYGLLSYKAPTSNELHSSGS